MKSKSMKAKKGGKGKSMRRKTMKSKKGKK